MSSRPHLTVAAIIQKDDKFLLVEEIKAGRHVFNQPAGHVENGETLIDAVKRETLEETGWEIELDGLLGFYPYYAKSNQTHYMRCTFVARAIKNTQQNLDPDIHGTHWLTIEEIKARIDQLRSPLVLSNIEDFNKGQLFSLEVIK